jgi:hypothetical protein
MALRSSATTWGGAGVATGVAGDVPMTREVGLVVAGAILVGLGGVTPGVASGITACVAARIPAHVAMALEVRLGARAILVHLGGVTAYITACVALCVPLALVAHSRSPLGRVVALVSRSSTGRVVRPESSIAG